MSITYFSEDRCVICGEIIEEGRQVCPRCQSRITQAEPTPKKAEKPSGSTLRSLLLSLRRGRS